MQENYLNPFTDFENLDHIDLWLSRSKVLCRTHRLHSIEGYAPEEQSCMSSFISLREVALLPRLRSVNVHGVWSAALLATVGELLARAHKLTFVHADNGTLKSALTLAPFVPVVELIACSTGKTKFRLNKRCFSFHEKGCLTPTVILEGHPKITRTFEDAKINFDWWNEGDRIDRVWLTRCETDIIPGHRKDRQVCRMAYIQRGSITLRSIESLNFLAVNLSECEILVNDKDVGGGLNTCTEYLTLNMDSRQSEFEAVQLLSRFASVKKLYLPYLRLTRAIVEVINGMANLEMLDVTECQNGVALRRLANASISEIRCDQKHRKFLSHLQARAIASNERIEGAWDEFLLAGLNQRQG
ncbi:MAG TPA: hypothetical protein VK171_16750 [Fimbriimonas sp.]|nr:hypothetical protein [Fimbriimonas sp.]